MSEYQYYEFRAIDTPLTPEEQREVARLSSRVDPHPTRAVFIYNWSDLPANAETLVARYYDAMLYTANWGSRQLIFRFPAHLVDPGTLSRYDVQTHDGPAELISVTVPDDPKAPRGKLMLNLELHEEEGSGWMDAEGLLEPLLPLRDAVMQGDTRVLYLAWLKGLTLVYDLDEDAPEPPLPPGLRTLNPALKAFAGWVEVDPDLLEVAAQPSPDLPGKRPAKETAQAISRLPEAEKDELLLRLAQGEPNLGIVLDRALAAGTGPGSVGSDTGRTVGELLRLAEERRTRRKATEAVAAETRRIAELKALTAHGRRPWREVEQLIETRQVAAYDRAVALLAQLRALAQHQDTLWDFDAHITQIVTQYRRRPALLERIRRAGLLIETGDV